MANNKKHEDGYATFEGLGYREIQEILAERGIKMRHTSVRNYYLRGLRKLAKPLEEITGRSADELARDVNFQIALSSVLKGDKDGDGITI